MSLSQCKAVVIYGRNSKGNRSGLVPPRQCQRPATRGDYCGLHARQAELQDLLRECLAYDWERRVQSWEVRKRRDRVIEGLGIARGLVKCARQLELNDLALFLSMNSHRVADEWADASG